MGKVATHTRVITTKRDTYDSKKMTKKTLAKAYEIESDTCQSEDNMKMPLVKVNASKNDKHNSESDTCENKGAQKR